ncbi:hypothetical protein DVH24_012301, partial [Malus domestica]
LSFSAFPSLSPSTSRISLPSPGLTRTESPSKRGSQRTPYPALQVRRHGVSSGEHRPFRGHFRPNHVSGESDGFRGIFRPKHGELDVLGGFPAEFPAFSFNKPWPSGLSLPPRALSPFCLSPKPQPTQKALGRFLLKG